jgi:hypothetical protein
MAEGSAISAIEKGETLLILAAIGVGAYLLYQFGSNITDFINKLFGVEQGAGSYTDAAATVVQSPVSSLGSILGIGSAYPSSPDGSTISGYAKIGASGQHYRCNTSGMCYPISIDPNGNELVSGVPVSADQAN